MFWRICVAALAALAWVAVTLMSALNLSDTLPMNPAETVELVLLFALVPILLALGFFTVSSLAKQRFFPVAVTLLLGIIIALIITSAQRWHRDYYSLFFQYFLLIHALCLLFIPENSFIRAKKHTFLLMAASALLSVIIMSIWIMMMGYAIASRAEPRWIESIVYNALCILMLFPLVAAATQLYARSKRLFRVQEQSISLDGREISSMLTVLEQRMLRIFIQSEEHSVSCKEFYLLLNDKEADIEPLNSTHACDHCLSEDWTATSCRFYRNIANRVLTIKKYLELLEIGTLVQLTEGEQAGRQRGWKLRFFDDVLLRK